MASSSRKSSRKEWLIPVGLLVLSFIPVVAGALRIAGLAAGAEITPENERFVASPVPVVVHAAGAIVYCTLGAFQFVPGFRRQRPAWHRAAGRILVPSGLAVALSGIWMTLFYPRTESDGDLLAAFRLLFGTAMAVFIVLGFAAILRRDVPRHRAWMIRAYAIGQGAGTQVVLFFLTAAAFGQPEGHAAVLYKALIHGAAWVLNLAIAEWLIRRTEATNPPLPREARVRLVP